MSFLKLSLDNKSSSVLLKTLENRLPKAAMAHNTVKLSLTGRMPPSVVSEIFALNGKIEEDDPFKDVFIVIIEFRKIYKDYGIVISSPNNPTAEMDMAFDNLVDWSLPICFCAIDVSYSNRLSEICANHGSYTLDKCNFLTMSLENAQKVQLNEIIMGPTIEVRELSPSDAKLAVSRWQFAQEGTEELFEEYIQYTGSAGVYENGRLISWIVIFAVGSINALFTEVEFRGKGYGELTMQKILQIAAERGLVPNVQVNVGNDPSLRLMERVGFQKSHLIEWVIYNPT